MAGKKKENKMGDLSIRALINGSSALILALFIFFSEMGPFRWVFTAAVATIAATAVWEYYGLVKKKKLQPAVTLGIVATILYVFSVFFKTQGPHAFWESAWQNLPESILALTVFACFLYYAMLGKDPIKNISTTLLGVVYIAVPMGLVLRIVYFFTYGGNLDPHLEGSWWLVYTLAVTKCADLGGYFMGRHFGKKKLAMRVSPNKTFEGAIGGLVLAVGMALLICYLGKRYGEVFASFSYLVAAGLGILLGILGQIGDLAESLLKRDAKVKDSNSIPGVGGVLDMVDSILFTSPVVYIFLRMLYT